MDLDKHMTIAVLGDRHTGKTNLAFYLLNSYEGERDKYILGYPREVDGCTSLTNFQDLFQISDGIIFVDEIQKYIKVYDKRANQELMELLSLFAHNNNTLIMTTPLSQFIKKGSEGFIDGWLMTRVYDLKQLKNGSKPKRIIQQTMNPKCTEWALVLEPGEYLEFSHTNPVGENGVKRFPFQGVGKDWKITKENVEETATKTVKNCDEDCDEKVLWMKKAIKKLKDEEDG